MHAVAYRTTGISATDLIRPYWKQLIVCHHANASQLITHYERPAIEERKLHFSHNHESGQLRLDPAADAATGEQKGKCVSTVSAESAGMPDSRVVGKTYRSAGIGAVLVPA